MTTEEKKVIALFDGWQESITGEFLEKIIVWDLHIRKPQEMHYDKDWALANEAFNKACRVIVPESHPLHRDYLTHIINVVKRSNFLQPTPAALAKALYDLIQFFNQNKIEPCIK